jgi:hypothetical protein
MFYAMVKLGDVASFRSGYRRLKSDILFQLQALLRGHGEGVLNNTDPLIPVDFEMEIDGTGAIFPGNSFQTSYLPKRYRKESIFQAIGVSHKISNSEWTTAIKGQIRAIASKHTDDKRKTDDLELYKFGPGIDKVTDDQVIVTQEASIIDEGFQEQLTNNGIDSNGEIGVAGTDLKAAAGEAVLGIGNVSVLTSTTAATQPLALVPSYTSSGNVIYRTIRINKN